MSGPDDWGVADGWWGTDGQWRSVAPETLSVLRAAQGADEHPDGPPAGPPMWFVRPGEDHALWSPATLELEDGTSLPVHERLPPDLPLGAHRLHPTTKARRPSCSSSPHDRHGGPARGGGRHSSTPQPVPRQLGHGDLADLATLARWTADAGGSLLAHNPLGAPLPGPHVQVSPYYASTRRFWSPLHLRIEGRARRAVAG